MTSTPANTSSAAITACIPVSLKCAAAALAVAAAVLAAAEAAETIDTRAVPVVLATAQPTVGELVIDESGLVDNAYFAETRICTVRGCRRFIFDKRSGALIHNDGRWSEAYAKTDRGREVIRVKAFTADELPKTEPPSDAPLDTAPAIKKVTRPPGDKTP